MEYYVLKVDLILSICHLAQHMLSCQFIVNTVLIAPVMVVLQTNFHAAVGFCVRKKNLHYR